MTETKECLETEPKNLKAGQEELYQKLIDTFDNASETELIQDQAFAVVGKRGSGKTTVLEFLDQALESLESKPSFLRSGIIDASKIDENQGLMAACVDHLWDRFLASHGDVSSELKDAYWSCYTVALFSEKFNRELTEEMTISPEKYTTIVPQWVNKSKEFPKTLDTFIKALKNACEKREKEHFALVIFIDDLDLAKQNIIHRWVKYFTKIEKNKQVYWVLSYSKDRMIANLSDKEPGTDKMDLEIGESILSKIIPFHRQYDLPDWDTKDMQDFRPLKAMPSQIEDQNEKEPEPLRDLMERYDFLQFLLLLPNHPRGLSSLYKWLKENGPNDVLEASTPGKGEGAIEVNDKHVSSNELTKNKSHHAKLTHRVLEAFCNLNRVEHLRNRLRNTWAKRVILDFTWNEQQDVSKFIWSSIINEANQNDVLRELPLPQELTELVGANRPRTHFEILCNIALKEGAITPFRLANEMPFTKKRLEACRATQAWPSKNIEAFFEDHSKEMSWVLLWGKWSDKPVEEGWQWELHPGHLIETVFENHSIKPVNMFRELYLDSLEQDECFFAVEKEIKKGQSPQFPKNLRALLMLVDSLKKAPWAKLSSVNNFWTPITITQCAASFILSAFAHNIWSDETIVTELGTPEKEGLTLYCPIESFSKLTKVNERAINTAFVKFTEVLKRMVEANMEPESAQAIHIGMGEAGKAIKISEATDLPYVSLEADARKELRNCLKRLLEHPAVTMLRLPADDELPEA